MTLTPTTAAMLRVLADLDEDTLAVCYLLTRDDARLGAPLDAAVFAWRDAGCPDAPPDPERAP